MSTSASPSSSRQLVTMEAMVGLFVAIVFIGLAVFTIVVSGATLFGKKPMRIGVDLPDGMGIRDHDPVIVRGVSVGTVDTVYYHHGMVHVEAQLVAEVQIHEGYHVTVVSTSILGGRQLVLKEGDPSRPLVKDVMSLQGSPPADLMADATKIVNHVSSGEGPLGKIVYDESVASNLVGLISNFRIASADLSNFTAQVTSGEGLLSRIAYDTAFASDIEEAVANLRIIAADLTNATARLQAGEGALGRLLYDDKLGDDLAGAVADIREISGRLERGEGSLGKLLSSDDAVYTNLSAAVASLKEAADRLERGEGSLGKLMNEDDLYNDIGGLVRDARVTLDDMRESSPISTFATIFFGAF
ncbi:MAG: MlaD family protein [Kiritimatiellia bacterium]|jgi:phospholipid/cholesterol/gamma-HCH transport system substrate-binding protein